VANFILSCLLANGKISRGPGWKEKLEELSAKSSWERDHRHHSRILKCSGQKVEKWKGTDLEHKLKSGKLVNNGIFGNVKHGNLTQFDYYIDYCIDYAPQNHKN